MRYDNKLPLKNYVRTIPTSHVDFSSGNDQYKKASKLISTEIEDLLQGADIDQLTDEESLVCMI
jgi:hypothetical protein